MQQTRKKIFIAGAGGMLGEAFYRVFKKDYMLSCTDKDVNETWLSQLDFRDYEAYRAQVISFKPDYLFHLGAFTDLEYCERHVDDTYQTNTTSVKYAVAIANELNIPLLYISTAGIFDGKQDEYDDWDIPNPLGHYAKSKYMGEKYVIENASRFLVCRAGWMMGGGPRKDKKFINKLIQQLADGKMELFVVNDKEGTPTFTVDFAKNVKLLLETNNWGLFNLVCRGETSRLEVAHELIRILGMDDHVNIIEVSSDHFKDVYFADRPPCESLVCKKLESMNMYTMQDWKTALREYLDTYYSEYLKEAFVYRRRARKNISL
ncbi:MAG TPA: NAD(P)-dependent oxidoreductase [Flavitalea sp.]|nr:NAD(P)-dependent oxidoreductase [Flavitalea sp.]